VGLLERNRSCPCGSGRPRHSCCGWLRRIDPTRVAAAYLTRQARLARDLVGPFSPAALTSLQAEAAELAYRCPHFPRALLSAREPVSSDVRRVARALDRGPASGPSVREALRRADTPLARVAVARGLVAVREAGLADEHVVAAAVLELASGPSPVTEVALCSAAATLTGRATPVATAQVRSPAHA